MELEVPTRSTTTAIDVTDRVEEMLPEDSQGPCTVFVPHTTAGVVVNEAEPGLLDDITAYYAELVPDDADYRHDQIDDNAAAHLRASVAGASVTLPVREGQLGLGTWQSILLLEFDGPRTRQLQILSPA